MNRSSCWWTIWLYTNSINEKYVLVEWLHFSLRVKVSTRHWDCGCPRSQTQPNIQTQHLSDNVLRIRAHTHAFWGSINEGEVKTQLEISLTNTYTSENQKTSRHHLMTRLLLICSCTHFHLFHKLKHLLRRQASHSSANGLRGLLSWAAVSIRWLNDGSSSAQTSGERQAQSIQFLIILNQSNEIKKIFFNQITVEHKWFQKANSLLSSSLFFSLAALSTRRARPLNSRPLRLRMALSAVSWSWYSQKP